MTILTELHQDHINLNKLLVLLRSNIDKLQAGGSPNFSLIADVINYISGYADGFHHPREDQMYQHFLGRDKSLDSLLNDCEKEHELLKQSSHDIQEAIDGVLHDAVVPMSEVALLMDDFVTRQTAHLNFEEGEIFPKLSELATDDDWKKLSANLPTPEDPLFGEKQAYEFSDLYKELIIDMNAA